MKTFKMPGLSRYKFTINGECIIENTGYFRSTYDGKRYNLKGDDGKQHSVSVVEILHYGKHLKQYEPIKQELFLGLGYDFIVRKMRNIRIKSGITGYNQELLKHKWSVELAN